MSPTVTYRFGPFVLDPASGRLTGKDSALWSFTGFNSGNCSQQNLGVGVRRLVANFFARSHLHESSKVHHTYRVTEMLYHRDAMGNEQVGEFELFLQVLK
jgi:hypothetical protein